MATYAQPDRTTPLNGRACVISSVAVGDKIFLVDALGKPASTLVFYMTDSTDTVEYRVNGRKAYMRVINPALIDHSIVSQAIGIYNREEVVVWSKSDSFPVFSETGEEIQIDGVLMYSIEIVGLTLSTGSTITIMGY